MEYDTYEAHNLNIMLLNLVWPIRRTGISASTHKTGKKLSNRDRTIDSMARSSIKVLQFIIGKYRSIKQNNKKASSVTEHPCKACP